MTKDEREARKAANIAAGRLPTAGLGRGKGTQNRVTKSVKEAIELAAEGLGGVDRLIAWAKEDAANERVFWGQIYPKLLPLQLAGQGGGAVSIEIVRYAAETLAIDTGKDTE